MFPTLRSLVRNYNRIHTRTFGSFLNKDDVGLNSSYRFKSYYSLSRLESRALLEVSGPDSTHFLMGLTTCNIEHLINKNTIKEKIIPYSGQLGAVLSAKGRILADIFVFTALYKDNTYYVDCDKEISTRLEQYLSHYVLRSKVNISQISQDKLSVYTTWNSTSEQNANKNNEILFPSNNFGSEDINIFKSVLSSSHSAGAMIDHRAPNFGVRFISSPSVVDSIANENEIQDVKNENDYKTHRIINGIAEGHLEISSLELIPSESNFDITYGIDFHKGCYLGQELVIRAKHKGITRNRIMPVLITTDKVSPFKTSIPNEFDLQNLLNTKNFINDKPINDLIKDNSVISFDNQRSKGKIISQKCNIALMKISLKTILNPSSIHIDGHPDLNVYPIIPTWWPDDVISLVNNPDKL